jgi:hypothetical protein
MRRARQVPACERFRAARAALEGFLYLCGVSSFLAGEAERSERRSCSTC